MKKIFFLIGIALVVASTSAPAFAACPYATKQSSSCTAANDSKTQKSAADPSDAKLREELIRKNSRAREAERAYQKRKIEEAKELDWRKEWADLSDSVKKWLEEHFPAALKVKDGIIKGINRLKQTTGQKIIIINGEEYREENGEFIKVKPLR